jgi:hypothetical protein
MARTKFLKHALTVAVVVVAIVAASAYAAYLTAR